jgi:dihydrofolate reductase
MISIIAAVAENGVIGMKNKLPWKLSADLKYFATTTTGKTVVMGKNTFLSIFNMIGKPLPNRRNIVLSNSMEKMDGIEIIKDINIIK